MKTKKTKMKKLKLHVPDEMYNYLMFLKKQRIDIDLFIQEAADKFLELFSKNPDEALKLYKELENEYQAKYKIN